MDLLLALQMSPGFLMFACALLGLAVGSFLNVVVHRLPKMMEAEWARDCAELAGKEPQPAAKYNLWTPRSACPKCGHAITAAENIPVLSWIALGGKCSACKTPISARYPLVELLTGALSAAVAWRFGFSGATLAALLLVWALVALTFIDLDTQLLPDDITLPLLWLGLLLNTAATFADLRSAVLGAAAGYLLLWCVYWGFRLLTGKEGMGFGDFKLLAALGAWLGWQAILPIVLGASVLGAAVGGLAIAFSGKGRDVRIPFGPYLAVGGLVALFAGRALVTAYLGFWPS
jgi:leader peptidase (prepilin peptidase) / N-methyltransferase